MISVVYQKKEQLSLNKLSLKKTFNLGVETR